MNTSKFLLTSFLLVLPIHLSIGGTPPKQKPPPISRMARLVHALEKHGLSEQWLRVAVAESGWELNSGLARRNNLFGLKKARARATCALPETYLGHATFRSIEECVEDLSLRVTRYPFRKNESIDAYVRRTGWSTRPDYPEYIMRINLKKAKKLARWY